MSNENNALVLSESNTLEVTQFSAFGSVIHFEQAQRMGKMLSCSSIVPETYRGPDRVGDCVIALEISNRIGASVLAVMQNLYNVHGKPAWSSQFLISCVNASRRFSPLRYKMTGNRNDDTWGCIAWAVDKSGERLEGPEVTIAISKAEGWYQKNGSKWKTMPQLMLHYRAATWFARLYAPELTMGIQTDEEVIDIAPVVTDPSPRVTSSAPPQFERPQLPAASAEPKAAESAPANARKPEAAPQLPPSNGQPELKVVERPPRNQQTPQQTLAAFLVDADISFDKFRRWAVETERLEANVADSIGSFDELPADFCTALQKDGRAMSRCVTRCKTYTE